MASMASLWSGKLVFAEPVPKDNEAATWREKLDQLYKSSSQNLRVVVHGSKVRNILVLLFVLTLQFIVVFFFLLDSSRFIQ